MLKKYKLLKFELVYELVRSICSLSEYLSIHSDTYSIPVSIATIIVMSGYPQTWTDRYHYSDFLFCITLELYKSRAILLFSPVVISLLKTKNLIEGEKVNTSELKNSEKLDSFSL